MFSLTGACVTTTEQTAASQKSTCRIRVHATRNEKQHTHAISVAAGGLAACRCTSSAFAFIGFGFYYWFAKCRGTIRQVRRIADSIERSRCVALSRFMLLARILAVVSGWHIRVRQLVSQIVYCERRCWRRCRIYLYRSRVDNNVDILELSAGHNKIMFSFVHVERKYNMLSHLVDLGWQFSTSNILRIRKFHKNK